MQQPGQIISAEQINAVRPDAYSKEQVNTLTVEGSVSRGVKFNQLTLDGYIIMPPPPKPMTTVEVCEFWGAGIRIVDCLHNTQKVNEAPSDTTSDGWIAVHKDVFPDSQTFGQFLAMLEIPEILPDLPTMVWWSLVLYHMETRSYPIIGGFLVARSMYESHQGAWSSRVRSTRVGPEVDLYLLPQTQPYQGTFATKRILLK